MKSVNMSNKTNLPIVTVSIVRGKGTPAQIRQFRAAFARLLQMAQDGRNDRPGVSDRGYRDG